MSKCDICGKESGEYTLCPHCFQEMQEDKLNRCKNCGKWYRKEELCSCVKNTSSATPTAPSTQEEEHDSFGCLIAFIAGIILFVITIIIGVAFAISPENSDDSETNIISQITKEKPSLHAEQTNLGTTINIQIQAKDNYDQVIVKLCLLDKNKNIISEQYLTKTNLKKGSTYTVNYNLSLSELTSADSFSYQVYKYE